MRFDLFFDWKLQITDTMHMYLQDLVNFARVWHATPAHSWPRHARVWSHSNVNGWEYVWVRTVWCRIHGVTPWNAAGIAGRLSAWTASRIQGGACGESHHQWGTCWWVMLTKRQESTQEVVQAQLLLPQCMGMVAMFFVSVIQKDAKFSYHLCVLTYSSTENYFWLMLLLLLSQKWSSSYAGNSICLKSSFFDSRLRFFSINFFFFVCV